MRSRMAVWCYGACAVIVACLLVPWLISGCEIGAEQSAQAPDEAEDDEQAPDELGDEAPFAPGDPKITLAEFEERLMSTGSGDDKAALLKSSRRVVQDHVGLARIFIRIMHTGEDEEIRMAAADELGIAVGEEIADEVVSALARAADPAREPDADVRWAAAMTLMDYPLPAAREALRRATRDPVAKVAHRAAASIAGSFGREGAAGWVYLIDMLGQMDGDASALASLQVRERGRAIVDMLIRVLAESNRPRQRAAIASCLGMICSGDTDAQHRFAKATKATRRTARVDSEPDPRPVEPLIHALSDPDANVREAAAQALGFIGDARASTPLANALGDSDKYVRKRAASALMLLAPSPQAFAALSDAAINDPYPEVRRYAVEALGLAEAPAAAETLTQALGDEGSAEVRAAAARYLGRFGDAKAVPALIARFTDEDADVRWAAVRSVGQLGQIGGASAERALQNLITSGTQEPQVMQAAREALRKLGGTLPLSDEAKRIFE